MTQHESQTSQHDTHLPDTTLTAHADPIVVGLDSTPGIYYAFCRRCGAYTGIRSDPLLAERELGTGLTRGIIDRQLGLPIQPEATSSVRPPGEPEAA